jgi:hypothetical protein
LNGAGKSNFVDALRFLRAIGQGRSIRDAIEGHYSSSFGASPVDATTGIRGGAKAITHFSEPSEVFQIDAQVQVDNTTISYHISVNASEYKVTEEWLSAAPEHEGPYVYSTNPEAAPLKQLPDSPTLHARYYTRSRGQNPSRSFSAHEPILAQFTGRKAEFVYNEVWASLLREELASIQPLELRPEVLSQYSSLGRFTIGEHGENLAARAWYLMTLAAGFAEAVQADNEGRAAQEEAAERLTAIKSWLSEFTPRPVADIKVEMAPTGEAIFALLEESFDMPLNARSLSGGTLRFAAMAFALLGTTERQIYVVEELENGISTSRLGLLIRMISAATTVGHQVITTTHSPTLLEVAEQGIINNMLFISWDTQSNSSRVNKLSELAPEELIEEHRLGELLTEGYLQTAAEAQ